MSLNYDLQKIDNFRDLCYERKPLDELTGGGDWWEEDGEGVRQNPVTKSLIFATMEVGLGSITKQNAVEFYARLSLVEKVRGAYVRRIPEDGGRPVEEPITLEQVQAHIGLSTNVARETPARWAKRFYDNWTADVRRRSK